MGKSPALAVRFANDDQPPRELLAAEIDGSVATAIHETSRHEWRVFYPTTADRDAAGAALAEFCRAYGITLRPLDVADENWARRSQTQLQAIRIGNIIVAPPWDVPPARVGDPGGPRAHPLVIIIEPSTGFGTGHHASTRLCLLAMQKLDLRGLRVIDVGTGSGILAIAAARLGAAGVLAIDTDADAVQNARENVARNSVSTTGSVTVKDVVDVRVADAATLATYPADVLLANLTAAWLRRLAKPIADLVRPGGALIVSGLQKADAPAVVEAFAGRAMVLDTTSEYGWTSLTLTAET